MKDLPVTGTYTHGASFRELLRVIFLTLCVAITTSGCSLIHRSVADHCKSHAYVRTILADYITSRYHSNAQVRMAIVPFSVPANLSSRSLDLPGFGLTLAQKVHSEFLQSEAVPIVELVNRQDWPGKKEEFATGNFGAIAMAREAGYDLVLVGFIESVTPREEISLLSKIIEVESGMTLWSGKTTAYTLRRDFNRAEDFFGMQNRRPDYTYLSPLGDTLASCVVEDMKSEHVDDVPWIERYMPDSLS